MKIFFTMETIERVQLKIIPIYSLCYIIELCQVSSRLIMIVVIIIIIK